MAAVLYSSYIPDVVVYANGCPGPTIIDALRKTCIDFFHESTAYRLWLPVFDLTIGVTTYPLSGFPADTEVCQILSVDYQGVSVNEATHEQFLALDPQWPSKTGTNPQYYTALDVVDTFNILPIPEATVVGAFNVHVALHPTLASIGMEQGIIEPWKDGIVDGALSILLKIKNRPWSDDKEAAARYSSYVSERTKARIQVTKGNIRRDITVQMRRWV